MNKEEETEEGVAIEETKVETVKLKTMEVTEQTEISRHNILEFSKKGTIKLWEEVKERGVIVLTESGATQNFIS